MSTELRGSDNFNSETYKLLKTPEVIAWELANGPLSWDGGAYTDPDAVGANATALIYPDGTIVGSTDNGEYTKYPNGDLTGRINTSRTVSVGVNNIYGTTSGTSFYAPDLFGSFPTQFVGVPFFLCSVVEASYGNSAYGSNLSSTQYNLRVLGPANGQSIDISISVTGRWK